MNQWGFFFNQDRCLGCNTCMMACKNWNDDKRGDLYVNQYDAKDYSVAVNANERESIYLDPVTKATNYTNLGRYHMKEDWRRVSTKETGSTVLAGDYTFVATINTAHLTVSCNHCDEPACVAACPMGCISKEQSMGAVITNPEACISCGKCRQACPWDAPQYYDVNFANYNIDDPARPRMTKCNFCKERIEEGLKPACVAACWNRALDAGPIEDLKKKYADKGYIITQTIPGQFEELSTKPNILFKLKES